MTLAFAFTPMHSRKKEKLELAKKLDQKCRRDSQTRKVEK